MKQIFSTRIVLYSLAFFGFLITSCSNDDDVQLPILSVSEVEIGSANKGIIGRDFHFNADVLAGDMIGMVQININPRDEETYSHDWSFEIVWDEFKGNKNATVHKHFDVPEDAAEGKYDFVITVTDKNGTKLEATYDVEIIDPANLPVDPSLSTWIIQSNGGDPYIISESGESLENVTFSKDDIITSNVFITNVKDNGKLYVLFIKKSENHFPENIHAIDFSKVIVYDVFEHQDEEEVHTFANFIFNTKTDEYDRSIPELTIGASVDNNVPEPNPIEGKKTWETGEYYMGVVYTNTTHDLSVHYYFDLNIVME